MPLLIIAGMPTSVTNRNRNYMPQVDDWNIKLIPSRDGKRPRSAIMLGEVLAEASGDVQGAHVLHITTVRMNIPSSTAECTIVID